MDDSYISHALAAASMRLLELRLTKQVSAQKPNAGAEWSITVPGGVIWEFLNVDAKLQTSAVVASRQPRLFIADADGNHIQFVTSPGNLVASIAWEINWGIGFGYSTTSGGGGAGLNTKQVPLFSGYTISSNTVALDVADQWSNINLTVVEWSETGVIQELMEIAQQMDSLTLPLVQHRS